MKKKYIVIPLVIIALIACSIIGYKAYQSSNNTAEVVSVSNLNVGYWGDESSSYGVVYDAENQSIYLDSSTIVSNVYVTEGQEVKAGDPLLAYDLTSLQLSVEMKDLSVQQSEVRLQQAQKELETLKNTKPIVIIIPTPTPVPTERPKIIPTPTKNEDAWDYITSIDQGEEIPDGNNCRIEESDDAKKTEETIESDDSDVTETEEPVETEEPSETEEPVESPEIEPTPTPDVTPTPEPCEPNIVTTKNIRFVLTEDGMILGSVLNELSESDYEQIWIETYEENKIDEEALVCKWIIRTDKLGVYDDESLYSVTGLYSQELEEEADDTDYDDSDVIQEGYTATELASMISDKQEEIRNLDLEVRQKKLDLQIAKDSLSDGVVYAKRDGVVSKVSDISNPPTDGSAFLSVTTSSGTYIETQISELQLDSVDTDTILTVSNWNTGSMYEARVVSIDTYPTNSTYSYSSNSNISYYNMYAVIEEDTDFSTGDWLQVSFTETVSESSIWISNSYIRESSGTYYVMKDENGRLVRQNIKVGATLWGEYREIKEGITEDDYIAFPYGKSATAGTKTVIDEDYGW